MSGISKNAQPTPAPDRLDPNWYPNETWSAFLLLVFILMGGCITAPFLFFLNVVTPGSSSAELARYAASLHAGRFASVASFILLAGMIFYFDLRRLHKHFTTSTLKDTEFLLEDSVALPRSPVGSGGVICRQSCRYKRHDFWDSW